MKASAILLAREERWAAMEALEKRFGRPVLSVTANVPGGRKSDPAYAWIGAMAFGEIRRRLEPGSLLHESFNHTADGPVGFIVAETGGEKLKRVAVEIEESHPLGRLFDIDVKGQSRQKKRTCLLCQSPVNACRRSNSHSREEIFGRIDAMVAAWEGSVVEKAVDAAVGAMGDEVEATPKPGLVDRSNSGSHKDMDYGTFTRSIEALKPFFRSMAEISASWKGSPENLFKALRPVGVQAETVMFEATKGINTHKGQIFSLGVSLGAWCLLKRRGEDSIEALSDCVSKMTMGLAEAELSPERDRRTHGEKVYGAYGVKGIRGEAEKGFPTAFSIGFPVLEKALQSGFSKNEALVKSLLAIMGSLEDSNVYRRGGPSAADWVRRTARKLLDDPLTFRDPDLSEIKAFDRKMILRNISPGGAADMLALSAFAHRVLQTPL